MMFADDNVICGASREQVVENLERWRFALEGRGMKVRRTECLPKSVNKSKASGKTTLRGVEVVTADEFKYQGSAIQGDEEWTEACRQSEIDEDERQA